MGTFVITLVLAVMIFLAVRSSIRHFKGEGGCCGGAEKRPKKKRLKGNIVAQKVISIEGMHCDHCKYRVEEALNALEGVSAKVSLKKHCAVVSMNQYIADEVLKAAVEKAGYSVDNIEQK